MKTFLLIAAIILFALAVILYVPWRTWETASDFRLGLIAAGLFCWALSGYLP